MTCPVENVVCHLQDQLGDKTGVRYTRERVLAWLNLALMEVAGHRPDLYAKPKKVTLAPGCVQNLCDQCERVTGVLYTVGNECVEPDKEEAKDQAETTDICDFLDETVCERFGDDDDDDAFAIREYTLDAENPCFLRIRGDGVPDDGTTYEAYVMCAEKPDLVCIDDDLPACMCGPYLACITWAVMARAMAVNEAGTSSTRTSQYMQQFYVCMNGIRTGAYALERDNFFLQGPDSE